MSPAALRLLGSLAISVVASAAVLVLVAVEPPIGRLDVLPSLILSAGVAALLFTVLAGQVQWPARRLLRRARRMVVRGVYLTLTSATEEVLWRLLVLGGLTPAIGLGPAFLAATIGFALAHGVRRRDVVAVHLFTGAVFGAVYIGTGRVEASILAHAFYNWLVVIAIESGVQPAPIPAAVGGDTPALLDGVRKRYGKIEALRGFSLGVETGEVVSLLGPNGAGKTTALSILLGLRSPDAGTARLFGRDPRDLGARRHVGVTPQETGFPSTLRVGEIVDLVRTHYPGARKSQDILAQVGLADLARRQAGGLSGGQKRRLAVGLAFVGNPRAIVLDEPTTGLDVESRRRVWDDVRAFAERGGTVLLTTHNLEEADALASRVVVIVDGETLADGSPAEVKSRAGLKRVRVEADSLPELRGVEHVGRAGRVHTLYTSDPESVVRHLVDSGVPLQGLEVTPVTLEEAFLSLTEHSA